MPSEEQIKALQNAAMALALASLVQRYSDAMMQEIIVNSAKGDFYTWTPTDDGIVDEIHRHFGKLQHAMQRGDWKAMKEYSADIGNFAMKAYQYAEDKENGDA